MVALGFIFLASANTASAIWNNYPSDCPEPLTIGNYTTGAGIQNGSNGCWISKSVSADAKQTINVAIFYDNTNASDANNSVIKLTQSPAGSMSSKNTSYRFSGNLSSTAGALNLSQVTANLSSSQTLTFSQAKWFKKASTSGVSLPSGQTGYEAFNSGLNMGTIAKGDWGTVIFSFSVGSDVITNPTNDCRIDDFRAVPPSISTDQSSTLKWDTTGCDYVTISNVSGNKSADGQYQVSPNSDTTYILKAYGNNGTDTRSLTLKVKDNNDNNNKQCRITKFNASDDDIEDGDSIVFDWKTNSDCDYVTLTGVSGRLDKQNDYRVKPSSTKTYTLKAYDDNGNLGDTDDIKITVRNNNDNNNNNNDYCTISNFTANGSTYNLSINQGDALRLVWDTQGCSSVRVSGSDFSSSSEDDSRNVYPRTSGNYTISAYSSRTGTITKTIYVTVNPRNIDIPQNNACTVTTVATNITSSSAQLNGLITNSTNQSVNTFFEYGANTNLVSKTNTRTVIGNGSFNEYVSGLAPNTYYYFRGSSNCSNGQLGNVEVFKTAGTGGNNYVGTTTRTVIVQGATVSGTESPIMLRIENKYQAIGAGDVIDYTVYYKNIGNSLLTNPVLQIVLPGGVVLTNSSRGTYSADSNTLSIPLENLAPGAEGVIYLQGRVSFLTTGYAQIVTTAILVYTTPNGAQENAIAYVLNNPKLDGNNLLGASAFFGGNFLGIGLIGWLLLLILILLIVLASRSYRNKTTVTRTYTDTGVTH